LFDKSEFIREAMCQPPQMLSLLVYRE